MRATRGSSWLAACTLAVVAVSAMAQPGASATQGLGPDALPGKKGKSAPAPLATKPAPMLGADATLPVSNTGAEFTNRKATAFATQEADYLCENLYDSANPVSMLIELAAILGPSYLFSQVPDLSGFTPADRKKVFSELRTLARRKVWLPVALESKLGEWLHERGLKDNTIIDSQRLNKRDQQSFDRITNLLKAVADTLPSDNPYPLRLGVMKGDDVNASISMGGYIYVTQGFLRSKSMGDPLITLKMAHEVSHLTRRHALKEFQLKFIDALEAANSLKELSNITTDPVAMVSGAMKTVQTVKMLFQHFEHNQELEGDACGMQLTRKTGPTVAIQALKAYVLSTSGAADSGWDKSHPSYEDRELVMRWQLDDALRKQHLEAVKSAPKSPKPGGDGPSWGGLGGGGGAPVAQPASAASKDPVKRPVVESADRKKTEESESLWERIKASIPTPPAGTAEPTPMREP